MSAPALPPPVEALRDPTMHHGRPTVELIETHISWLLLAGERVFKVKKPVVFPFLDYGTLERRRRMCEEEVRLGRRFAPDVYVAVRALVPADGGFTLAEAEHPGAREYAVEMRRFDEERTLAASVRRGAAGEPRVRAVGRRVASFHALAERAPEGSFGPRAVAATVDEGFESLLEAAGGALAGRRLAAAHRFATSFVHAHRELLGHRAASGFVRDCHGDLRAEHVILDGDIQVFDPVEFDPALRQIDVAADLAFLVMDLEELGSPGLATALVEAYRRAGGDYGSDRLLAFYASYRAWVRAMVAALRGGDLEGDVAARDQALAEAERFAALGSRFAWRARLPLLLVVCGRSATGKTVVADGLAAASSLPHLSSDLVRKELVGLKATERAPLDAYADEVSAHTYAELGRRAAESLGAAGGAIVDATFRRRVDRQAFAKALGDPQGRRLFVECVAPATVLAERAARREPDPARVSDASPDVVERQRFELEPLDEVPPEEHLVLRTDRPAGRLVEEIEAALDARWR